MPSEEVAGTTVKVDVGSLFRCMPPKSVLANRSEILAPVIGLLLIYIVSMVITHPHFIGDTPEYVDSIVSYSRGVNNYFWDFGHLLWRPFGWLSVTVLSPLLASRTGCQTCVITGVLLGVNMVAGAVSVLLLYMFVYGICRRWWAASVATMCLIFAQAFLNFTQTGVSYLSGLSFLLLGLVLSVYPPRKKAIALDLLTGVCFALAVCLWFLYILALPAALSAPVLFTKDSVPAKKRMLRIVLSTLCAGILAYGFVIAEMRISSVSGLRSWMASSSHGPTEMRGAARMAFGLPRSWMDMGDDGTAFKRFLLADPVNPVAARDLLHLGIWKLVLFYCVLATMIYVASRAEEGKRIALFLLLNAVPVIGFAIFWRGADIERYLPLYPAFLLGLAFMISPLRRQRLATVLACLFTVSVIVTNVTAMSKSRLQHSYAGAEQRIGKLLPMLTPGSRVVVLDEDDELMRFQRDYPFSSLNRSGKLHLYALVSPATVRSTHWRQEFAAVAFQTWEHHGSVWISNRLFQDRPRPEWKWVEGDDSHLHWQDIVGFTRGLTVIKVDQDPEGFALVDAASAEFLNKTLSDHRALQSAKPH